MTAVVRCFCHSDLVIAPVASTSTRYSTDSVMMLPHPYLGRQTLSSDIGAPATSDAINAPAGTKVVRVEVQNGKTVHYEVTPEGHDLRVATTDSPTMEGRNTIGFGQGWRLSVLEAAP